MFSKGLDEHFLRHLNAEYERGGWWRAIASDTNLFIAIRDRSLNVYSKGASLLRLWMEGEQLVGETHYKYLLRPDAPKPNVRVVDGKAQITNPSQLFLCDIGDVLALKRASAVYVGEEKVGVHRIAMENRNVIDLEVGFGLDSVRDADPSINKIDFAALQSNVTDAEVELIFYEAKLFTNQEIRAKGDAAPPVFEQIERYEKVLAGNRNTVEHAYRTVCGNLAALLGVRDRYSATLDTMRRLADWEAPLRLDQSVRLVVFGFGADELNGEIWKRHQKKLADKFKGRLLIKGSSNGFTKGISAPWSSETTN
jgi:hypothetical protein